MIISRFVGISSDGKGIRYVRSAIEDIAFTNRSSKETIWVCPYCRRVCIEHGFAKGFKVGTNTGTKAGVRGIMNERAELCSR
jgi:hypothetical protein